VEEGAGRVGKNNFLEKGPGAGGPPVLPSRPWSRVIFTADDFGLSEGLNRAVALALRHGLLRCASLMVSGPAAAHALALARDCPELCLGVHLTLIQGRAVLPRRALPNLTDSEGYFAPHPVQTGCRYFFQARLLPEIRRELAAQIEAALATGLTFWFLNSHLNLHLHPRILPVVVGLAREYGIPAMRLVREDWRTTLTLAPDRPWSKLAHGLIFAWLSARARGLAQAAGLVVNDHLFGLLNHGRMTEKYLLGLIPRLKPGLTEIYLHPALAADREMRRATPTYLRREEFMALLSSRVHAALTAAGLEVTDFRQVVGASR